MWIHVPSLASVQDTEESNLDSMQLSLLEQSATWKTKSVSQQSWLRVWKTEPSMRLLYGLTLEPSTLNRGATKWISSLEDSLASHTQLPEESGEKTTQENSAEKFSELPKDLDTQLSFSKMFLESLDTTGIPYDPNYERWVMKLRKDYSQRQKQELLIDENAYLSSQDKAWTTPLAADTGGKRTKFVQGGTALSLQAVNYWRTPSSSEAEGGIKDFNRKIGLGGQPAQHKLRDQVASWPTPTTQEIKHNDMKFTETGRRETKDGKDSHSLNLQDVSAEWTKEKESWPTPNASEHKYRMKGNSQQSNGLTATARKDFRSYIRQTQANEKNGHSCSPKCRRLNPLFAEMLMGLCLGWTDASEPLEMESFLRWQQLLGSTLQRNLQE